MTEQQPQEPYGDPQYESYREGMPTQVSAGRTVIGDADIAHTGIIHVPADRVSADHISADRVDTRHRRVGPDRSITAAPGTTTAHPIRILFSHAASRIRAVCARPFPDS